VFDFSLGNPSVPAPACVNDTIRRVLAEEGGTIHAYTSAQGDAQNRAALAASLTRRFAAGARADDLYLTVGAAASLTISFHALCVPGDEFVVLAPFFGEYRVFIEGAGGRVAVAPCDPATFLPDMEAVARAVGPNTKAVVINTPNNPTGVVYPRGCLEELANLLRAREAEYGHPIFIITDEPYRELVFAGHTTTWVPSLYADTLVCYSYSKSLSIPGERIGYIFVPAAAADHDRLYAAVCGAGRKLGFVNAPALFQRVAAACDGQTADVSVYERNAALLYDGLTALGFSCLKPGGTFYLLLRSPVPDAVAFCEQARAFELLLVPTDTFGCPGWVRIAHCMPTEKLRRSLPAFAGLAAACGLQPRG
jgi:aspartate aminotransferase